MTRKAKESREIGGKHGVDCGEFLALINEYVDGSIDPGVCKELETHLAECNPCRVVVDNVRKTITLYRNGRPLDLPVSFRNRLHRTLREHWKKRGSKAAG